MTEETEDNTTHATSGTTLWRVAFWLLLPLCIGLGWWGRAQWRSWRTQQALSTLRAVEEQKRLDALSWLRAQGSRALPAIRSYLRRAERHERDQLVDLLVGLGPRIWSHLKEWRYDDDWRIRAVAIRAVGAYHTKRAEVQRRQEQWMKIGLHDTSPFVQFRAVDALRVWGARARPLLPVMRRFLREGQVPKPRLRPTPNKTEQAHAHHGHTHHGHDPSHQHAHRLIVTRKSIIAQQKPHQHHGLAGHAAPLCACGVRHRYGALGDGTEPRWGLRRAILTALQNIEGDPLERAKDTVLALIDQDRQVRRAAAHFLLREGAKIAPVLFRELYHAHPDRRFESASLLGRLAVHTPRARKKTLVASSKASAAQVRRSLIRILARETASTWEPAWRALRQSGKEISIHVPRLCRLFQKSRGKRQIAIVELLAQSGGAALPCLRQALAVSTLRPLAVRGCREAAPLLSPSQQQKVVTWLLPLYGSASLSLRRSLIVALGAFGVAATQALPLLLREAGMLTSTAPSSRPTSIRVDRGQGVLLTALARIARNAPKVRAAIRSALQAPTPRIRLDALRASRALPTWSRALFLLVLQELTASLRQERDAAALALWQHRSWLVRESPTVRRFLRTAPPRGQEATLWLLGRLRVKARPFVTELLPLMKSRYSRVREAALWAVAEIGGSASQTLPLLQKALRARRWQTRAGAARALGRLGKQAWPAFPMLRLLLRDRAWRVRRATAYAVGEIGPRAAPALPALRALVKGRVVSVRVVANDAIQKILR